jgi:hypothetical protein
VDIVDLCREALRGLFASASQVSDHERDDCDAGALLSAAGCDLREVEDRRCESRSAL